MRAAGARGSIAAGNDCGARPRPDAGVLDLTPLVVAEEELTRTLGELHPHDARRIPMCRLLAGLAL